MVKKTIKWIFKVLTGIVLLLLIIGTVKQKIYDYNVKKEYRPSGKFSNIGNNNIHFEYDGEGEITFVLISGLGETLETWNTIYEDLQKMGQVFRYDRSGLGFSEEGILPRSVNVMAEELNTVLNNENIKGSFVLIGHSAGAFLSRHFANKYPEQVIGIFLIDPYQEMAREQFGEWPMSYKLMNWSFRKMAWSGLPYSILPKPPHPIYKTSKAIRTYGNEAYPEEISIKQFKEVDNNSDLPIYLISADNSSPKENEMFRKWNEEILSTYNNTINKHIVIKSGHHVHIEKPDLILSELTEFVSNINNE